MVLHWQQFGGFLSHFLCILFSMNNSLPLSFSQTYRPVHSNHEDWAAAKSTTAGGVARQDANPTMGRRSGHPRRATEEAKCRPFLKKDILKSCVLVFYLQGSSSQIFSAFAVFFIQSSRLFSHKFFCFHSFYQFQGSSAIFSVFQQFFSISRPSAYSVSKPKLLRSNT